METRLHHRFSTFETLPAHSCTAVYLVATYSVPALWLTACSVRFCYFAINSHLHLHILCFYLIQSLYCLWLLGWVYHVRTLIITSSTDRFTWVCCSCLYFFALCPNNLFSPNVCSRPVGCWGVRQSRQRGYLSGCDQGRHRNWHWRGGPQAHLDGGCR